MRGLLAPSAKAFRPNWQRRQRLVPRPHNLPRTTVNAEDCAGQSIATEASRARVHAAEVNSGPGARLRVALQRRLRTYPAMPRTSDAAAITAPGTLASPTNASYRRHLGLVQTISLNTKPLPETAPEPYIPQGAHRAYKRTGWSAARTCGRFSARSVQQGLAGARYAKTLIGISDGARQALFYLRISHTMEIPLNLPRDERQQAFLDYLNSALRGRTGAYSGSAGAADDGAFNVSMSGPFQVGQSSIPLAWTLCKNPDGQLTRLVVEYVGDEAPASDWERAVYEFVTSVLATTLSNARTKYFHRSFFYYIGPQLDGEYWLPGYRFAPAYPGDPHPHLINAERVVSIDQQVLAIDNFHAFVVAEAAARRHSARISLLLNTGLYGAEQSQRWVWPVVDGVPASESVRYQLGFQHPSATLGEMPRKGRVCTLGAYRGSLAARYRVAGELLSLPAEARKILRGIDSALPAITEAFDRGARLYQVATVCGRYFPSVALAYRVAAVEAISAADPSFKGFSDFMRRHVRSQRNIGELLNYMYGAARSAHFHGGEFPMGEFSSRSGFTGPFMDADAVQRDSRHRACHELTREAIVNWLVETLPEQPESIDQTENQELPNEDA